MNTRAAISMIAISLVVLGGVTEKTSGERIRFVPFSLSGS